MNFSFDVLLLYHLNHKFIKQANQTNDHVFCLHFLCLIKIQSLYLLVGTNANPIPYTTSGIYRKGTSITVETSPSGRRYICYDHFTENEAKVVCLIWGLLP